MNLFKIFFLLLFNSLLVANSLSLTKEELEYIQAHPVIYTNNNFDYTPFDYQIGNKSLGYSIDLLNLLAKKIGIKIVFVQGYTWKEFLEQLKEKKIDLIHTAAKTPKRAKFAFFSKPYYQTQAYFFTKKDTPKIKNLHSIEGRTIAVRKGWAYEELFRKKYPKIKLYLAKSDGEMIEAVRSEKAFAFVFSYNPMHFYLSLYGIRDMVANAPFRELTQNENAYYHFMTHKDTKPLIGILNKALDLLSESEKEHLKSKWLAKVPNPNVSDSLFTQQEKQWLEKNEFIKIAYVNQWDNEEMTYRHVDRRYVKLLSKYANINIQLVLFDTWSEAYNEAVKGENIDGILYLVHSKKREQYFDFLPPYYFIPLYLLSHKNSQIRSLKEIENGQIFTVKDSIVNGYVQELPYNIEPIPLSSDEQIIKKLSNSKSKVKLGIAYNIDLQLMQKNNIQIRTKIYNSYSNIRLGVTKSHREVFDILKKAHESIPKNELTKMQNTPIDSKIDLTTREAQYLQSKDHFTVCVAPSWMPFSDIKQDGTPRGMVADFMKLFASTLGKKLTTLKTQNWNDVIKKIKNGRCDIVTLIKDLKSRRQYLQFTKPLASVSYVVATNKSNDVFVDDFKNIKQKVFAVVKNSAIYEDILRKYPNTRLIEVKTTKDGLEMVRKQKAYGYIDASASIAYELDKLGYLDFKIINKLPMSYDLSFGVKKNDEILFGIVDRITKKIDETELERIYNKWVSLQKKEVVDYSLVWQIVSVSLVVLLLIALWNRQVSKTNRLLKLAQEEITIKNEELEKLATIDGLTKLKNRVKIEELISNEVSRYERYKHPFSLCILDVDYFKKVNDTYGHQVGDKVLQEMARLMQKYTRQIDFVGRWGGEEFIIVCPRTDKEGVMHLCEYLREQIASFRFEQTGKRTISIGASTFTKNDTKEKLIQRADEALYEAKNSGRNRVVYKI